MIEHHLGGELEAGQHECWIDAALEAVARVGIDGELAPGLRDVDLVPQRRFDQHVGSGLRAAGGLAAHDAGERFDALLVGDHAHALIERVGLAVERQQRLAVAGAPDGEMAMHLGGVEHMQRAAAVVGDEVGDVDQRVDRAQADGGEPLLQPVGRGAVLDALDQAQAEGRTERGRGAEIERDLDRAGERALDRLGRAVLEGTDGGGAEIARDAVDPGTIRPVGREIDLDHRIAQRRPFGVRLSDRRIGGQFDDAVVIVGNHQLGRRAQHAAAFHAADGAHRQGNVLAGDEGAGRREHAFHAGVRIGRAAHDLNGLVTFRDLADVDHADAQAIRVRVLLGGNDRGDDERLEQAGLVLDVLDLEPDHGELVDDRGERLVGVEMLLEPGQGEFHGLNPPASVGKSSGRKP